MGTGSWIDLCKMGNCHSSIPGPILGDRLRAQTPSSLGRLVSQMIIGVAGGYQ